MLLYVIIDKFRVDSSTGLISTIGLLDSDVVSLYNLTVEARDGGTPNYRAITVSVLA